MKAGPKIAIELGVVAGLLAIFAVGYLAPGSVELLRGNASVMIGDGTDSVTNPWQYQLIVDTFGQAPVRLLYGAVYTEQLDAPFGFASYIPFVERLYVLLLAPLMRTELMPTAVIALFMLSAGLSFYGMGRVLGWPRAAAFVLAVAWAFCPYTRARAVVHIALVGTAWLPLVVTAIRLIAGSRLGWSRRAETAVATLLFLLAVMSAHYYVIVLVAIAPVLAWYVLKTSRLADLPRLALAILPSVLFLAWTLAAPVPAYAKSKLSRAEPPTSESNNYLHWYGAHAVDYVTGDVKFGTRDWLPLRSKFSREVRQEAGAPDGPHERANGIRWSALFCAALLVPRILRRRSRRRMPKDTYIVGILALALGGYAFVMSLPPQAIELGGHELGPIQLVNKLVPQFRIPNRLGVVVHFSVLLAAGVVLAPLLRKARGHSPRAAALLGLFLLAVVVVDYLPMHPMPLAAVVRTRPELVRPDGSCGSGIIVPYSSHAGNETDFYLTMTEIRGTSCAISKAPYLSAEDLRIAKALSSKEISESQREGLVAYGRCTGASWAVFRPGVPERVRRSTCADLGFSFVSEDACRADRVNAVRPAADCVP